jgi:hypothetical protein
MQEKIRVVVGFFEKMPSILLPSARAARGSGVHHHPSPEPWQSDGAGMAEARQRERWFIVG